MLAAIPHLGVQLHEVAIAGFLEWLELDHLGRVLHRESVLVVDRSCSKLIE